MSRSECRAYWASGEPRDKAGAYAVQGRAAVFIEHLAGSYSGVMGLPLFETAELLAAAGIPAGKCALAVSIEILVNVAPSETRAAILDNGVVQEVYIERTSRRGLVSNLYKGRVSRVLPGMQAAFVEIGLERTAFLHAADIARSLSEDTQLGAAPLSEPAAEDIRRLVNSGDDILVQVIKDPIGTKGARLTTFVSLPSRYLVYMPRGEAIGVSARIEDEAERARLKALVGELAGAAARRRLHRAHRGAGRIAREPARGHELPGEAVGARAGARRAGAAGHGGARGSAAQPAGAAR